MKKPEKPSKGNKPEIKLKIKAKGSPEAVKAAVKKIVK
jgi:hypothetical protein